MAIRNRTDTHVIDLFAPASLAAWGFPRRAMDTPVSRVKYRVRRRNPLGIRRQSGAARVNAPGLQFSLGGFLLIHFDKLEIRTPPGSP